MVCWPRTRQWPRRNNCRGTERAGRDGAVIAAGVAVHSSFAATFCSAAEVRGTIEEDIAVTIPPDIEAQILRYYHAERWRVGTIAKQLRVRFQTRAARRSSSGSPTCRPPDHHGDLWSRCCSAEEVPRV